MKKQISFICLFLAVTALHAKAIQEEYKIAGEKAKLSYAFGMLFGSNLNTTKLEFDYNAFTEGFKAALEGAEPLFSEQEAVEIVENAMHDAMEKTAEQNRLQEEGFLELNKQQPGIQVTESGLQYEVIVDTDGQKPASNSVVWVNYEGSFLDGSIFDKSEDEGAYIPLEMVIPGWTEGILMMGVGSKYRFYIPSHLAYGKNGIQNVIPPYSTLIFTVELLEIMNLDDESEAINPDDSEFINPDDDIEAINPDDDSEFINPDDGGEQES